MRREKIVRSGAALATALVVAGVGGCAQGEGGGHRADASASVAGQAQVAGAPAGASAMTSKVMTSDVDGLGKVLVGDRGRTLYLFDADKSTKSTCTGECAKTWPPALVNGKPSAGSGARANLLDTTTRQDGKKQATYKGHPLYYFSGDAKAGDAKGEGSQAFGAKWWAVNATGGKVMKKSGNNDTNQYRVVPGN
ncbi:hypothetical protein ACFV3R_22945 [Streptomyces sp. NPDC059740]|uniref:COG4315 family predicted lipoprotein n=1 Tax=Streptomyces sp. NPDC059740 TaxID=3346926 RepID=UPI00365EFF2F